MEEDGGRQTEERIRIPSAVDRDIISLFTGRCRHGEENDKHGQKIKLQKKGGRGGMRMTEGGLISPSYERVRSPR